jgi:hypothetical protein
LLKAALSGHLCHGREAPVALNLVMFPSKKLDVGILKEMLTGG